MAHSLTFIISSIDNLKYSLQDATSKTKEKLTNISAFTSQTIYELRDTIWAMNKESITFEDLQARITNFINKANDTSESVDFTFQVAENISAHHKVSSVVGMNIYRIVQEAVNNALKYAKASTISVNISEAENMLVIAISDNGKGFLLSEITMGNGLNNMKKRAHEINGEIEYHSEINKGTTILLSVPEKMIVKE